MQNNVSSIEFIIKTKTDRDKMIIGREIHRKLRGKQDYIDSNIVLNVDEKNTVRLLIFDDAKRIPRFLSKICKGLVG